MDHFLYRSGVLHAEDVPVPRVAEAVGTPFYLYSTATLERHYRLLEREMEGTGCLVSYAVKANSNQAVLATLARLGAGMDVVSGGEYARARAAGVPGARIVFSGVGKTRAEMERAIGGGVRQFNVESEQELRLLGEVAAAAGAVVPVAVRVNPDVDAGTHEKISTGRKQDKFGVPIGRAPEAFAEAAAIPGLDVVGIACHIGSQLTDLAPFALAFDRIAELAARLRADGHDIRRLDLGGGLGIPYGDSPAPPSPAEYCRLVRETAGRLGVEVEIEPGRLVAGNAGILVGRVIRVKSGEDRTIVVLDCAMNDLARPAMYGAFHEIVTVAEPPAGAEAAPCDVVGPVCESADVFASARPLAPVGEGDLVAFRSAGAYGAAMASEYNSRPLVPEALVRGDQFAVIRARPTVAEMIERDIIPHWL